ncbi:MAG: alpha/beta hydrolase [Firmicutes bacterium HGW-Firmicutes-7]|nr:MAG: alpha/beta hydrolase [Firmicutes bacterium HGW-Firmicutes-7]
MAIENTWKEIYIPNKKGTNLFCNHYYNDKDAPNIIYIQTPIGSVKSFLKKAYEPLAQYGFNIFAVDFSGIGKSMGNITDFSRQGTVDDLDCCVEYICERFTGDIHLYAGTGTGGIFGEYYASTTDKIRSFAQYGVGIYGDVSIIRYPKWITKMFYILLKGIAKVMPRLRIFFPLPKYSGYHAELDNTFYEMALQEYPDLFKQDIHLMIALLGMFLDKESALKLLPQCPTLVFETLHDRYFSKEYFRKYYDILTCEKKLYSINDIHNSYYFHSDEICKEVAKWFIAHA